MTVLTRPSEIVKGIPAILTLNKSDLAALVSGDAYYSNPSNWKAVTMMFQSTDAAQNTTVYFDCDTVSNLVNGTFRVSLKAKGNIFNVGMIRIHDFDGGSFPIYGSTLNQVLYRVNLIGIQAPTWLTAEALKNPDGTNYVMLSWQSVYGADSYRVYRASTAGGPYTEIASFDEEYDEDYTMVGPSKEFFSEFFDDVNDLVQGETYYYVVRAYNGDTSIQSPEASAQVPLDSILGTWFFNEGEGRTTTLTFNANTYTLVSTGTPELGGMAGTEEGAYTWDNFSRLLTIEVTNDGNGEWGLSHEPGVMTLIPAGNKLYFYIDDELAAIMDKQ